MSNDIYVIDMAKAEDEAEEMGREVGREHPDMDVDDIAHLKESQRWNNGHAKQLRILSGHEDLFDKGTYHGDNTVAVVSEENADDVPAEGFLSTANEVYRELEQVWREGLLREVDGDV